MEIMEHNQTDSSQTSAELQADDLSLVGTLTFIWCALFLIGVGLYSAVAVWTATHPLGHGS